MGPVAGPANHGADSRRAPTGQESGVQRRLRGREPAGQLDGATDWPKEPGRQIGGRPPFLAINCSERGKRMIDRYTLQCVSSCSTKRAERFETKKCLAL